MLTAILVGVGALLSSFGSYLSVLWGLPRSMVLQDPIGWALRPGIPPLAVVGMLVVLALLVGLTWLFVRWVVASALPGKGAAVFFGTWGALIIAAMVAGLVRAVVMMVTLRIPTDNADLLMAQFQQFSFVTATWAVTWGWIVALVAALVHRGGGSRTGSPAAVASGQQFAPGGQAPQYAPQQQQYTPQQQHAPQQYAPQQQQYAPQQQFPQPPAAPPAPGAPSAPPQHPGHSA